MLHDPEASNQTEVHYRLAWARTYLKKYGVLTNSQRGIWALVNPAITSVNPDEVVKTVRGAAVSYAGRSEYIRQLKADGWKWPDALEKVREKYPSSSPSNCKKVWDKLENVGTAKNDETVPPNTTDADVPEEAQSWRATLHHILTQQIDPSSFERLVQRLLRESGFVQVEVTGRSGDGGIDGKGIARIHGFMSFHVVFQCKRYQGVVSSSDIRDFRGAMVGRADKGLFITTGSFSRDAVKEATRDGAPPIDLVDGDQLADKLKEFRLGVRTEMIENVAIDGGWFKQL